ncbi:MAG: (Fe-S)-binding protein [Chloroflexota bacterium]
MSNKELIPPGLAYLADNITSKHNLMGVPKGTGANWAKDLHLPKSGETIFFAGCGYQYMGELESLMGLIRKIDKGPLSTEMAMSMAGFTKKLGIDAGGILRRVVGKGGDSNAQPLRDAVKVLDRLGIKFGYLAEDEPCCGGLLHYIGMEKEFTQHARSVYDTLKSKGVKRIISIVPSCTFTLKRLIPSSADGNLEVKHFTEVVAEGISSLDLNYPKKVKVTYHDPCQLVRYLGLVEEPRKILKAIKGIEFVEPAWTTREWATCCGGGGGFEAVFPELSEILAVNRAKELVETGAEIIVTHCPGCVMQLKTGLEALKVNNVEVLDLTQILAMAVK